MLKRGGLGGVRLARALLSAGRPQQADHLDRVEHIQVGDAGRGDAVVQRRRPQAAGGDLSIGWVSGNCV